MAEDIKQANPAPLGLVGFGFTTVMLSLINAGVLPKGRRAGGVAACIRVWRPHSNTGWTAGIQGRQYVRHGGVFVVRRIWWWFTFLVLLGGHGVLDLSQAGSTIAVALLGWGVFTLYMWVATFKLNKALGGVPYLVGYLFPAGLRGFAGHERP